ncbi:MAG: hypothetical protein JWP01_948 [Myxococcales bacterium]|nr:hypothetical protein [Myxococcales bacterium]
MLSNRRTIGNGNGFSSGDRAQHLVDGELRGIRPHRG